MINANELVRAVLEEAAWQCTRRVSALDDAGNAYYRPANADQCAIAIQAIANDPEQVAAIVAKCGEAEPVAVLITHRKLGVLDGSSHLYLISEVGSEWVEHCKDNGDEVTPLYTAPVVPALGEDGERAEFEALIAKLADTLGGQYVDHMFDRHSDGGYHLPSVNSAWVGWQAGRAALREGK